MAGAGSNVRAGGAFVEIFAKDAAFQKSLQKIRGQLQAFGSGLRSFGTNILLGAGIVGTLGHLTSAFSNTGSEVNDMAERTGLSTDALQELGYAATQAGSSLGAVERGIRMMQKQAAASGVTPEEMFMRMADELAALEDPAARTAFAMKHFGRSGAELIPMLKMGRAGLEEMRAKARELGLVMSAEDVKAADDLGDAVDTLTSSLGAIKNTIMAAVAPVLTEMAGMFTGVAAGVRKFISENRGLARGLLIVAVSIPVVGGAMVGLGISLQLASVAITGFLSLLSGMTAVAGFLASPLGMIAAGIVGIGLAVPAAREAFSGLFGMMREGFGEAAAIAGETFGAIVQAMTQGDIQAAANVMWAGLNAAWLAGTAELRTLWTNTTGAISSVGISAFYTIMQAWDTVTSGITAGWQETVGFVSGLAIELQAAFVGAFAYIGSAWTRFSANYMATMEKLLLYGEQFMSGFGLLGRSAAVMAQKLADIEKRRKAAGGDYTGGDAARKAADEAHQQLQRDLEAQRKARAEAFNQRKKDRDAAHSDMQESLQDEIDGQQTVADARLKAAKAEFDALRKSIAERAGITGTAKMDSSFAAIASKSFASIGSFSAAGLGRQRVAGLGVIEDATRETAEHTAEIARNTRNMGVEFA